MGGFGFVGGCLGGLVVCLGWFLVELYSKHRRSGGQAPARRGMGDYGEAARGVEDAAPYGVREGCSVGQAVRRPEDRPPYGC